MRIREQSRTPPPAPSPQQPPRNAYNSFNRDTLRQHQSQYTQQSPPESWRRQDQPSYQRSERSPSPEAAPARRRVESRVVEEGSIRSRQPSQAPSMASTQAAPPVYAVIPNPGEKVPQNIKVISAAERLAKGLPTNSVREVLAGKNKTCLGVTPDFKRCNCYSNHASCKNHANFILDYAA